MFSNAPDRPANDETKSDYVDVLIIGAGISGLGAAYELKQQCPEQSFAILEGFESYGGTWLWHKYPGIRSDSDLFTFGYRFKPWLGAPIASGAEILKYLGEVIEENNLAPHIRYRHRVQTASWDSRTNLWTVVALRGEEQDPITLRCRFLWMCQGYYRHSKGYTPDWPGMSEFEGRIVHPQTWPQALDYEGKRVIVIGSGATAATVVPAIAADCDHVTLLQRSPTYFSPGVNRHWLADALREIGVDETTIHDVVRRKIVFDQYKFLQRSINDPESAKADLLKGVLAYLPQEVVDKHFTPNYRPWRQRIAVVPDGDLFESVNAGKVSVVTDNIERFTKSGIALKSVDHIDADIIVPPLSSISAFLETLRFLSTASLSNFRKPLPIGE